MTTPPPAPPPRLPNLKPSLWLGGAGALAALALFPYLMALMPHKLAALPISLPALAALQAIQSGVLCWLLAWLGLYLGAPYGLGAPWLSAWVHRRPWPTRPTRWALAATLGVLAAVLVGALSWLAAPQPSAGHGLAAADWAWRGLLASFYGGIVEEVQCRLLLVSALVWLLARCNRRVARPWMFVLAIVGAAVLFGVGHLPAAFAAGMEHSVPAIARIVFLNAVVALVTGGLFWKYGFEHAVLAHFCADLVLHVAMPLALG